MEIKKAFNTKSSIKLSDITTKTTKNSGLLVFKEKDLRQCKNHLDFLLRKLFIMKKITHNDVNEAYKEFAIQQGIHMSEIRNGKGNLMRRLKTGKITWDKFLEACDFIFKLKIINIKITFENENGDTEEISLR